MQIQKPLLSICIPTYNRSKYLRISIESIISQQEFLDGRVEIVVSDNASEDDTSDLMSEYTSRYENIFYHRNSENVRDENFPIVLSEAHGTLRKLCNDTLIFKPGALCKMCKIVEENQESRPYVCWANGTSKCNQKQSYMNFHEYIINISFWMTWIASFSLWDNECTAIRDETDGCELLLWQVKKSLHKAYQKNSVLVCNERFTDSMSVEKKNISYGLFTVFYENYFEIFKPYFEMGILQEADREYLEKDLLFNFFKGWCANWEIQSEKLLYSPTEDLKQAIWTQYHAKPYWMNYQLQYNVNLYWVKIKKIIKKALKRT